MQVIILPGQIVACHNFAQTTSSLDDTLCQATFASYPLKLYTHHDKFRRVQVIYLSGAI